MCSFVLYMIVFFVIDLFSTVLVQTFGYIWHVPTKLSVSLCWNARELALAVPNDEQLNSVAIAQGGVLSNIY